MMKRLLSLFVAILATTALWAYDFKYGDLYYNITSTNTVEVTSKYNTDPHNAGVTITSVAIPNVVTYKGITYRVVAIGDYAFCGCFSLASVTIPNSVTRIGEFAFHECKKLAYISVPNTVTKIGDCAFISCSSLTSFTIPNGVTKIEDCLFCYCSSLASVTIPNSVITIEGQAFDGCSSLTSIVIPNGVTSIGWWAFQNCKSLWTIHYTGTEAQWNNITKGKYWKDGTPATIICSAKSATPSRSNIHNGHEYVDLGLSVKWATCNVGANKPEEYGDYFAWGEVKAKEEYYWSTYKWCIDIIFLLPLLSKYTIDLDFALEKDNKTNLEAADDAARVNWGGSWRMPTEEEQKELINNCTMTWTTQNGVSGVRVTSKINGNNIFLPVAGYRNDSDYYGSDSSLEDAGKKGSYWSSSLNTGYSCYAWGLGFDSSKVNTSDRCTRCNGYSVRPVCP